MPYRLRIRFPGLFQLVSDALAYATSVNNAILTYAPLTSWIVNGGNVTFQQGQNQSFNVASTGPSGYTAGGTYDVASGSNLPSGMTLSTAGVLQDSGAAAGTTNGVVFGYTEPGALPVLTLHNGATTGTLPYMATVYPCEGAVPSGRTLASPQDSTLRASVLSSWPDGSAQVMVVAGQATFSGANQTQTINLRASTTLSGSNLTPAFLSSLFSANAIQVNFGTLLTLTSTQLANNWDRIWWQNPAVICARYRIPITNLSPMEAVIDVHAFAGGRAFVEVVIENSKFNANAGNQPAPTNKTYTNATVIVNGSTIATVSSSGGPQGSHRGFSAWYTSTWVGGDPGVEVTHDTASLYAHPLFYKYDRANPYNYLTQTIDIGSNVTWPVQPYSADVYSPWATGRIKSINMGGGGDSAMIGPFTQWDSRYLQSGDRYVRRAVIANTLAVLTFNINYRHSGTGASANYVPNSDQSVGYILSGGWPRVAGDSDPASWEVAHHPAAGLVAFLCRPSPCFIEIAQKIAHWNGAWSTNINDTGADGTFGQWYQVRGKGWCMRSLAHAVFLSPDGDPWKTPGKAVLVRNVTGLLQFRDSPANKLDFMWGGTPTNQWDDSPGGKHEASTMVHLYFSLGCHAAARAKVLTGADQANAEALADWSCKYPVRHVNEAPGGSWRYVPIRWAIAPVGHSDIFGDNPNFDEYADYAALVVGNYGASTPALSGTWMSGEGTLTDYSQFAQENTSGAYYPTYFYSVLTLAVERDISGAASAWSKVQSNITNIATWRNGFAAEPRWGFVPRNV